MALDFSKLNFFSKLDARARVFVLLGAVFGVILIIYLVTKFFATGNGALGPSSVASAPAGLQSVPGGTQSAEYNRAYEQANLQRAEQARVTGGSAIPTLMNLQQAGINQCIICADQSINIQNTLDEWIQKGKISPDTVKILTTIAAQNVSPDEFADQLNRLVASGKLSPEQARMLLEQYKKQHANALAQESAKVMDDLIKRGQLPLDGANDLLASQKEGISTTNYAGKLQAMVDNNSITPGVAQQLLAQYTQQRSKAAIEAGIANIRRMVTAGQLTSEAATELIELQKRNVPVDLYKQTLDKMVADGKITPAVAKKLLDDYIKQKGATGPIATANQMLKQALDAAYGEINDLMKAGQMSPEVGAQLTGLIEKDVSIEDFRAQLAALVQQNKLTPDIAKLKYDDYRAVKGMRETTAQLSRLQGNNASLADYEKALRALVQQGDLLPDQAARLMQEYQASKMQVTAPTTVVAGPGTDEFSKLQQRLQEGGVPTVQPIVGAEQFVVAQTETQVAIGAAQDEKVQSIMSAMSGQAQQLISSWQPVPMVHKEGTYESDKAAAKAKAAADGAASTTTTTTTTDAASAATLIKAGSVLFAVLDTAVNSDYPDSPVMATIVDGKFKGAKLLGKLTTTKSVAGQMDRVSLNFTLMNTDEWPKSKAVTAYAIDPDTARTVLASNVNYHYLQRFGAIMATSFVQGYASAIAQSSSTTTTGIFGTSTTHPELSPSQKLATAIGQIGTALGNVTQNYTNIPPTVKVDSGVGLGILFMSDVS